MNKIKTLHTAENLIYYFCSVLILAWNWPLYPQCIVQYTQPIKVEMFLQRVISWNVWCSLYCTIYPFIQGLNIPTACLFSWNVQYILYFTIYQTTQFLNISEAGLIYWSVQNSIYFTIIPAIQGLNTSAAC